MLQPISGARPLDLCWWRLGVSRPSRGRGNRHGYLRGLLGLLLAGMVGSYAAFLKGSEPWVLWKDPVEISKQENLGIPVPKSLLSRSPSLDQTPDGMTMFGLERWGMPTLSVLDDVA